MPGHLKSLREQSEAFEALKLRATQALSETHIVDVAAGLCRQAQADLEDLAEVGLAVDVLRFFRGWRNGRRDCFRPRGLGLVPSPSGAADRIRALRIQVPPFNFPVGCVLGLLHELLCCTDPHVRFVVSVNPGANLDGLRRVLTAMYEGARERVRLVELESATPFPQDNARPARDKDGAPCLLIPRAFAFDRGRAKDALDPAEAAQAFGIPVVRSRFHWEGGNVLAGEGRCFVGADTIAENMHRIGLTAAEVTAGLQADFGAEIVVLGEVPAARWRPGRRVVVSGQASYHVDLDIALLGRPSPGGAPHALVADPDRGLELLDVVLEQRGLCSGHFLPPREARVWIKEAYRSYADVRRPKLTNYRRLLEAHGYCVTGIPDLRVDPSNDPFRPANLNFSYCNVVPGRSRGVPAVYYLPWGIRPLDEAAEACFRAAGVKPVRVSENPTFARELARLSAGLHCFCGPLL